jgi:integrase
MYIERRRRVWYALHTVPPRLRKALGKVRFVASLETEDRATAERRAAVLKAQWLSEMAKARTGNGDHVTRDAEFWRKVLEDTPDEQKGLVRGMIGDEAEERVLRAAARQGILDTKDPRYEDLPELAEAEHFVKAATGQLLPFDAHLEEWTATLREEPKTTHMKRKAIQEFTQEFRYVQDVTRKGVQQWVNRKAQEGLKAATIGRKLSEVRSYWSYLISIQVVAEEHLPLAKLALPKESSKGNGKTTRAAFEAADVVKLLGLAGDREDSELADLIQLGMWTGARIEELCALKADDVTGDHLDIQDAKTAAGVRKVPIHSQLQPVVRRLLKGAKGRTGDPFLIAGQHANMFGDRSGALGKRFGRLKTGAGYGERHVFHSIRKTVATLLENAGVPEGVAADIIGHDKPTMTYGLYSGGASMKTKREAIEKLRYPLGG